MPDKKADRVAGVRNFEVQFPREGEIVFVYFSAFSNNYKEAARWAQELKDQLDAIHVVIAPHEPRTLKVRVCADKEALPSKVALTQIDNPEEFKAREIFTMPCYHKAL